MKGQILKNWSGFDCDNPEHRKEFLTALQFFFSMPDKFTPKRFQGNDELSKKFQKKKELHREAIQFFATLNDFPATPKDVIEKFHEIPLYDNGFERIFDVRDFSGSRRDGFSMLTVQSGLTFKKMLTGEKLKVYEMSGDKEFVYFDYYGGALGWHRSLFDNQDYWTIEDNAIEFRNEAYRIRAATFYALIEAVAGTKVDIGWVAPTPAGLAATDPIYQAVRDANTMNYAAETILLACVNKGYGISPQNVNFVVLMPLQLRARIRRAMLNASGIPQIDYNFLPVTTTMLTATDHYWVILPGKKNKAGYRMDLTTFTDFDILAYTDTVAGWMAFGGAIGDTDQLERCDTI